MYAHAFVYIEAIHIGYRREMFNFVWLPQNVCLRFAQSMCRTYVAPSSDFYFLPLLQSHLGPSRRIARYEV